MIQRIQVSDLHEALPYLPFSNSAFVQLTRGPFQGSLWGLTLPHGAVWMSKCDQGFLGSGDIPQSFQLFALSVPGSTDRWHGQPIADDGLAVSSWSLGMHHRAGENNHIVGWMFPREKFCQAAETLGLGFDHGLFQIPWVRSDVTALRAFVLDIFSYPRDWSEQHLAWCEDTLIQQTLLCLQKARHGKGLCHRRTTAERIRRWLDLNNDAPLSTLELCQQFGLHERTLRNYFSREFDVSPMQYHLALRMSKVRAQLLRAAPCKGAVSKIATACGFWHMGRFGQQYRWLFGETPEQTLRSQHGPHISSSVFFSH